MVWCVAADIVQKACVYAYNHESLDLWRLHPFAICFDVNEGGAVDADPSAMVNAVAQIFVVKGFNHSAEAHNTGGVVEKLSCKGNGGHESSVKFGLGMF